MHLYLCMLLLNLLFCDINCVCCSHNTTSIEKEKRCDIQETRDKSDRKRKRLWSKCSSCLELRSLFFIRRCFPCCPKILPSFLSVGVGYTSLYSSRCLHPIFISSLIMREESLDTHSISLFDHFIFSSLCFFVFLYILSSCPPLPLVVRDLSVQVTPQTDFCLFSGDIPS